MNKADIDEIIKWFATYVRDDLEFGAIHKIENTGKVLRYSIKIEDDKYDQITQV